MRTFDGVPRRELLRTLTAVGAAGVLGGCDLLATPEPEPDPLLGFLSATKALAEAYAGAIGSAPPALATLITPIRDAHRTHVTALTSLITSPSAGTAASAPASTVSGTGARAALLALEKTAARSAYEICLTVPAARATLLGEIAAARACHVMVLS